jgi:hypothetical protein
MDDCSCVLGHDLELFLVFVGLDVEKALLFVLLVVVDLVVPEQGLGRR